MDSHVNVEVSIGKVWLRTISDSLTFEVSDPGTVRKDRLFEGASTSNKSAQSFYVGYQMCIERKAV